MKKLLFSTKFLVMLSVIAFGFSACKKDGGGGLVTDGWKIGSTVYNVALSARPSSNILVFLDAIPTGGGTMNMLSIEFASSIATGTYTVTGDVTSSTLAANEVRIMLPTGTDASGSTGKYYSLVNLPGTPAVTPTLTVTDAGSGKLKVVLSPVIMAEGDYSLPTSPLTGNTATVEINATEK